VEDGGGQCGEAPWEQVGRGRLAVWSAIEAGSRDGVENSRVRKKKTIMGE
jgi:hypothetical protein